MPTITGNVSDVLGIPLPANRALRLRFQLSDLGVNGQYMFITKPVYVTPSTVDGSFSVNLIATGPLRPAGLFYRIAVEWLDSELGMPDIDWLPWKLLISGNDGGTIGSFLQMPIRPDQVWFVAGTTPPPQSKPGDLLFDTTTSNLYRL